MNRLREEMDVAGHRGVAISALLGLAAGLAFVLVLGRQGFPPSFIVLAAVMGLIIFIYGFLVSYVYGDAKRRGMRAGMWAVIAALVPNALGLLAYFLVREPLLQACAACGAKVRRDLPYCPQCGSALRRVCAACRHPVDPDWSHCAHCGARIGGDGATAST